MNLWSVRGVSPGSGKLIVAMLLSRFLLNTLLLIGNAEWAKTPLSIICAMGLARWHSKENGNRVVPAYRISPDLDFFRGEEGCPEVPCIGDDQDLQDCRPKTIKAFYDASLEEAMTRERWGASKFVLGQFRAGSENEWNESAEPTNEEWARLAALPDGCAKRNAVFWDMVGKSFPKGLGKANIAAMKKRMNIVLNTSTHLFIAPAGTKSDVIRVRNDGPYITKEAGQLLFQYKRQKVHPRSEDEEARLMAEEAAYFESILRTAMEGGPADITAESEEPAAPRADAAALWTAGPETQTQGDRLHVQAGSTGLFSTSSFNVPPIGQDTAGPRAPKRPFRFSRGVGASSAAASSAGVGMPARPHADSAAASDATGLPQAAARVKMEDTTDASQDRSKRWRAQLSQFPRVLEPIVLDDSDVEEPQRGAAPSQEDAFDWGRGLDEA